MSDTTPRRAPTLLGFVTLGLFWGAWAVGAAERAGGDRVRRKARSASPCSSSRSARSRRCSSSAVRPSSGSAPRAVAVTCAAFAAASTLPGLADSLPALIARAGCGRRRVRRARRRHQRERRAHRGRDRRAADAARARPLLGRDPRRRGRRRPRAQPGRGPRVDPARASRSRSPRPPLLLGDRPSRPRQSTGRRARSADRAARCS